MRFDISQIVCTLIQRGSREGEIVAGVTNLEKGEGDKIWYTMIIRDS